MPENRLPQYWAVYNSDCFDEHEREVFIEHVIGYMNELTGESSYSGETYNAWYGITENGDNYEFDPDDYSNCEILTLDEFIDMVGSKQRPEQIEESDYSKFINKLNVSK